MRRLWITLGVLTVVSFLGLRATPAAPPRADDKKAEAKARIALFRLKGSVSEKPEDEAFPFAAETGISLKDLVARLKKAKDDSAVKAVVILPEGGSVGTAQVEEIRQAMKLFRDAGKDVYIHADSLEMRDFVLASGASRLSVVPTADLWVTGLHGEAPYLRGLLNILGVQPDFLHCGAYKSAAEVFMREGPSPEAEQMQNWLLDGLYDTYVKLIAKGRKVEPEKVRGWIDAGPFSANKAKEAGLIDAVEHRQDFEKMLREKYGKEVVFDKKYGAKTQPTVDFGNPFAIFKIFGDMAAEAKKKKTGKDAVAIVYVAGPITLGGGSGSPFDTVGARSSPLRKALDDAARDDSVKAVVLRVDSPGGSAVASEIILDATRRVKAKKPFVVSMGDVAASGGYYVACAADTIFADEATITGSIGVVGGKLVTTGMWKKIGVHFKEYKRGRHAGMLSSGEAFSPEERAQMQAWMDEIYRVFKGHVEAIRGKRLRKPIDELAGGRVYTGRQALELGLVDRIGTLQDAIEFIAGEAKLKDYDIRVVPEPKNFIEQLLEEMSGGKDDGRLTELRTALRARGEQPSLVDLALPYLRGLDPRRVAAVRQALARLQLIQQEGVILMMPETARIR